MAKVLIVEDNKATADLIEEVLLQHKYLVEVATRGMEALDMLQHRQYDVVILDWMLPEMSGVEVCKRFRSNGGVTPVLMLTAKGAIDEKDEGFDSGADDYLTKPFQGRELCARLRALLRRPEEYMHDVLRAQEIVFDTKSQRVTKNGKEVNLYPIDRSLLEFLLRHPNEVFSPETLLNRVWSSNSEATPAALRKCIERLRKQLDTPGCPSLIRTVPRAGYILDAH